METTKKILLLVLTVCMNFATDFRRTAATGGSEGETAEAAGRFDAVPFERHDRQTVRGYDGEASVRDAVEEIGGYGGEEE